MFSLYFDYLLFPVLVFRVLIASVPDFAYFSLLVLLLYIDPPFYGLDKKET